MHPENVHAKDTTKEQFTLKDTSSCNSIDLKFTMRDSSTQRLSLWTIDSSTQAYSGLEDHSIDPPETPTDTSTLNYGDGHALEEPRECLNVHGTTMVYLKDFVLIDDEEDGDMSLREKTVHNLTVMDGNAADLVCGRLLSTSRVSTYDCKGGFSQLDGQGPEFERPSGDKHCCTCSIL
ncbi:uncharacterized protein LOC144195819 [Stigmatopora nigra]